MFNILQKTTETVAMSGSVCRAALACGSHGPEMLSQPNLFDGISQLLGSRP